MPLDSIFLSHLTHELDERLNQARIDKIHQPNRNEVVMSVRATEGNLRLLISANQNSPRIQITKSSYENPASPPMFCMLLRKHLQSAKIVKISNIPLERVCKIQFDAVNEMGDREIKTLILEIMGRSSNIIFAGNDNRVISALSYIDITEEKSRQLIPGVLYEPPQKLEKLDIHAEPDKIKTLVLDSKDDISADSFLLSNVAGISPLLAREAAFRACGAVDTKMRELDPLMRLNLFSSLTQIVTGHSEKTPTMLLDTEGAPWDFSFLEIKQYNELKKCEKKDSYSLLLDDFYMLRDRASKMKARSAEISRLVQNLISRTQKKLGNQEIEIENFQKRDQYRIFGELLTSNLHNIKPGDSSCTVQNYYSEALENIKIPLDITKGPSANAGAYFKRFQKAKNGEKILLEQIEKGKEELIYLESIAQSIGQIESERDISQIREELVQSGYLSAVKNQKKKREEEVSGIKELVLDGFKVYVGRNNRQNDYIISKLGRAEDYWLHVLNMPGAHVLVKCGNDEITDATLTKAAEIAAFYSRGSGNKNIPITFTKLKNVKKPNGAKPGYVIFTTSKTAYVDASKPEFL